MMVTDIALFFDEFECEFPEDHFFQELELALCAMPTRWWGAHKDNFVRWQDYQRMMRLRFVHTIIRMTEKYNGRDDTRDHLEN